jgi:hypothetical protein
MKRIEKYYTFAGEKIKQLQKKLAVACYILFNYLLIVSSLDIFFSYYDFDPLSAEVSFIIFYFFIPYLSILNISFVTKKQDGISLYIAALLVYCNTTVIQNWKMRSNQLINSFSTPHEKKYSSRYFYFAYILIPLIILPLLLSVFANQISNLGLPYKDVLAPYITLALMSKPVIFMVWLCVLPLFEIAILIINKQNKNYKIFTLKVLGDDKFLENTIKTRVSCSLIYFINALLILVLFDFLELIYPMCEPNSLGISWKYNSVQLMLCTILTICTELIYLNSNILSGRSVNRTRYNTKKIRPIYFSVKQDKQTIKNLVILLFSIFIFRIRVNIIHTLKDCIPY